jgi:hypothetical protein
VNGTIKRNRAIAAAIATVAALVPLSSAFAANPEPVVAEVTFVDPVTITETNALQYGLLDAGLANGEEVVIAPDGSVTDVNNRIVGGAQAAAELTVTASGAQAITILIDTVSSGSGYTLGSFVCSYDGGADTACDAGGYSATSVASASLAVGATLTGDGSAAAGVANGSFNVTVSYQ